MEIIEHYTRRYYVYNTYIYKRRYDLNGFIYLRCRNRQCPGSAKVRDNVVSVIRDHDHPQSLAEADEITYGRCMRKKSKQSVRPFRDIISEETMAYASGASNVSNRNASQAMNRARKKETPNSTYNLKQQPKIQTPKRPKLEHIDSQGVVPEPESTSLRQLLSIQSEKYAPNSLHTKISMLKTMLLAEENIDIGEFRRVNSYLRQNSVGYMPKKSKTLNQTEVLKFLNEAPDDDYLMQKVVLTFGILGACRRDEITYMKVTDIEDRGSVVVVNIPETKHYKKRSFCLRDDPEFNAIKLYRKYVALRPKLITHDRFFLGYKNGLCNSQVVGKNSVGNIPCKIATFLGLDDAHLYTGHSMRRSSATQRIDGGGDTSVSKCSGDTVKTPSTSSQLHLEHETNLNKCLDLLTEVEEEFNSGDGEADDMKIDISEITNTQISLDGHDITPNTCLIKEEDPFAEDYDEEYDGGDSQAVDKTINTLDITNTQILLDEVEPLRVDGNPQYPTTEQCDLFGKYIAKHLEQFPLDVAIKLQLGIQTLVMQTRSEYIRQHPSEAPLMVKQEPPTEEDEPIETSSSETPVNQPSNVNPVKSRAAKRPQNTDPTEAKKVKVNHSETENSNSSTTHSKQKRTVCTVFAEQIALQLEQFSEEMSLQLQYDIYELIRRALPNPADEGAPNRVKIKGEIIEIAPTEIIYCQNDEIS